MIEQACTEIASKASDKDYIIGLITGSLTCSFLWWMISIPELFSKIKKIFREISSLTKHNEGIITVFDLVTAIEISPDKASKFLTKFARKLDIKPEVNDSTGTIFYRFISGDRIKEYEREKKMIN